MSYVHKTDPCISELITKEEQRQQETLSLIASENYVSAAVAQATGSCLTNKYGEGYPGKRYYAGCAIVDQVETVAIERCKDLFGADYANVQPHAGSQANMAVYYAALKPGDTIMGMSLADGGHLTHGHAVNFSGLFYKTVSYGVSPETEQLDYDAIEKLACEKRPQLIICGASAYSRIIDFERFAAIAHSVGALLMADIAHIAGLIAANVHPSPVGYADFITTTTHKTLRGPRGGLIMAKSCHGPALDRAIMPGTQGGPFFHAIAAKAVAFHEALQPTFRQYQEQVCANARELVRALQDYGYKIVSGGTDNHVCIVDVRSQNITGLHAQQALEKAGIVTSKSCIPRDPQKPWITSGIRLGTPAVTTRGLQKEHMHMIARWIDDICRAPDNQVVIAQTREKVKMLCHDYPIACVF